MNRREAIDYVLSTNEVLKEGSFFKNAILQQMDEDTKGALIALGVTDEEIHDISNAHEFLEPMSWYNELHGLCGHCGKPEDSSIHYDTNGQLL